MRRLDTDRCEDMFLSVTPSIPGSLRIAATVFFIDGIGLDQRDANRGVEKSIAGARIRASRRSRAIVSKESKLTPAKLTRYAIMDGGVHYYTREEILDITSRLGLEVERNTEQWAYWPHDVLCACSLPTG